MRFFPQYLLPEIVFVLFAMVAVPQASELAPETSYQMTWQPRGAYSGLEFTSLESPPGFPCVVAFTTLQNGGLKVSTDCGAQYASLLFVNAHSVTAKNELVGYVAAGPSGVIKTTDQGGIWFAVNDGLPVNADARSLTLHLGEPDSIYCGVYNEGVFAGGPVQDSLVQWTAINEGLTSKTVRHIARVRGGTYMLAATDGGIFRYEKGSWTMTAPGVVANRFVIDSADSNRVYAATESGVAKSLDQGRSFFPAAVGLPPGLAINDIARRTDMPHVLYAGSRGQGVFESLDFGVSWHAFGPPVPGENDVRAILAVVETDISLARVFVGTRVDGLFEANYSTPVRSTTWGRLKDTYR